MKLPPAPVVAPRLPAPPPAAADARTRQSGSAKAASCRANRRQAGRAGPGTARARGGPAFERPIEKPVIQRPPETGLFERTNGARTSQAAAAVTTGGFGSAAASPRDAAANGSRRRHDRWIQQRGARAASGRNDRRGADGGVRSTGECARPAFRGSVTKPIDRPVEIVFKPTPEYTDEARSARIEGTVSLELEFTAAGDVRVLRVVRGLGHGLDEAAQRAALRIRFKPAQSDGRPVDSRATVHITFRLS